MAKHLYTFDELVARKHDLRTIILELNAHGYGTNSRVETKDMHNLRVERAELSGFIFRANQPVATK